MTKKVLISGYYGADNFGDEAILETIIQRLNKHNADITVLSVNPKRTTEIHKVKAVNSFDFLELLFAILKCDILISGGGSLLQDVTSVKSLFYYLFILLTAQLFGKKTIIFAQGIGPIKNKIGEMLTKFVLKNCNRISVRDDKSLFLLRSWGLNNAILVCDPLFNLEVKSSDTKNKVGIQLRKFKTLSENLLITLANRVALDFPDKDIVLYSFQDTNDLEVCNHFKHLLQSINSDINIKIIYDKTQQELIDSMADLEYMIAMRFHAILIALKYGIKTLAINYDYKVENIANEAHIPILSMSANENYKIAFNQLRNLSRRSLIEFANNKKFSWDQFDLFFK